MGWQRVGWLDHGEALAVNLAVLSLNSYNLF